VIGKAHGHTRSILYQFLSISSASIYYYILIPAQGVPLGKARDVLIVPGPALSRSSLSFPISAPFDAQRVEKL